MSKIIISGYYGFDNIGDEAILMSMIKAFKAVEEEIEITVLSGAPKKTSQEYGVEAINRNNPIAVIKEIKGCDLFISGGGSLLQDITGWKSVPFYLTQIMLAKIMAKKTMVYAQGVGPVQRKLYKFLIKKVFNRVDYISVRDANSRGLLKKWGVTEKDINLNVDPVFLLKNLEEDRQNISISKKTQDLFKADKPVIAVSVRPWNNNDYLPGFAEALADLAKDISANILILALHNQEDIEISQQLKDLISNRYQEINFQTEIIVDALNYNPEEIIEIIANCNLLLGVRLHSVIFAALNNVPFVAVEYDPKVKAFLEMIALTAGVEIEELDKDRLLRISKSIWNNRKQFAGVLEQQSQLLNKLAVKNLAAVFNLLEEVR